MECPPFNIDIAWNPVRGCSAISEGCRNCSSARYAAHLNGTRDGDGRHPNYDHFAYFTHDLNAEWTGIVQMVHQRLKDPLRWIPGQRVMVGGMSDLFHERVTDEYIRDVFAVMAMADSQTFFIETKRALRMEQWFGSWAAGQLIGDIEDSDRDWPLPNVYIGASAEHQAALDERAHAVLATPAAGHFFVLNPLLGSIDMEHVECPLVRGEECHMCLHADGFPMSECVDGAFNALEQGVDWVVVGCETGPRSRVRRTETEWIHDVVTQCGRHGIPCYYNKPVQGSPGIRILDKQPLGQTW